MTRRWFEYLLPAMLSGESASTDPPATNFAPQFPAGPAAIEPAPCFGQRIAGWFRGLTGFVALSSVFHVLVVGMIAAVPMHMSSNGKLKRRRHPVDTEIKTRQPPTFEMGPVTAENSVPKSSEILRALGMNDPHAPEPTPEPPAAAPVAPAQPEITTPDPREVAADAEAAESTLAAALAWLARHQSADGHWSLSSFESRCRLEACGGAGTIDSDAAATGLALLPFLGAEDKPELFKQHQSVIGRGLRWLLDHQRPDGDLSAMGEQRMYSHAVAGLAICRAYGQTGDDRLAAVTQAAINFSAVAQNSSTGGWHYEPGGRGNMSSVAWQLLLLRCAERNGLKVQAKTWQGVEHWLEMVTQGKSGGLFCYEPQRIVTPTMTCVGMLELQYRGRTADDPAITEGHLYLLAHPPDKAYGRDVFYWYFGTPVVRNFGNPEWQSWFHRLRRSLIDTQATSGCAQGSWFLGSAAPEVWSSHAGRLMTTSLAAQLLESETIYTPLPSPEARPPIEAAARDDGARR